MPPEKKIEKAMWILFTAILALGLGYLGGVKGESANKAYVDKQDNEIKDQLNTNTIEINKIKTEFYKDILSEIKDTKKEINQNVDTRFEDIKALIDAKTR